MTNLILTDCVPAVLHDVKKLEGVAIIEATRLEDSADYSKLSQISKESGATILCALSADSTLFQPESEEKTNSELFFNDLSYVLDHGIGPGLFPAVLGVFRSTSPKYDAALLQAYCNISKKYQISVLIELESFDSPKFEFVLKSLNTEPLHKFIFQCTSVLRGDGIHPNAELLLKRGALLCVTTYSSPPVFLDPSLRPQILFESHEQINSIRLLIFSGYANQISISNNINFKTQLTSFGGMGYHNILEYIPYFEKEFGKDITHALFFNNLFKMLGWWKEPVKEEKKLKTWICDFCKKEFDEDHSQFSKFDHIYCSMNCLRGHLKAQSK